MKITFALTSTSKVNLLITAKMKRGAKANGARVTYKITPDEFLKLTTRNQQHVDELESSTKTVDFYNDLAKKKEILVMPYLDLHIITRYAKVKGHEGRHRAIALRNEGVKLMEIALYIKNFKVIGLDEIPEAFEGEYSNHIHKVDPSKLKWLD